LFIVNIGSPLNPCNSEQSVKLQQKSETEVKIYLQLLSIEICKIEV